VFSPGNSGSLLQQVGLPLMAPTTGKSSFDNWWAKVEASVNRDVRKGLNSLIILGVWSIWRHRNDFLFNGATPNVVMAGALLGKKCTSGVWQELRAFPSSLPAGLHKGPPCGLSRAREGLELVEGTRRRLYSKVVAGLGPRPRRRAGAMAEALCAPGRQGPKNRSEIQSNLLN